jgi:UDP-glucose 4-epimerase
VVEACRRVTGIPFPERLGERRAGDPPSLYADAAKIRRELRWSAAHTGLDAIIESAWRWKQAHPRGYA